MKENNRIDGGLKSTRGGNKLSLLSSWKRWLFARVRSFHPSLVKVRGGRSTRMEISPVEIRVISGTGGGVLTRRGTRTNEMDSRNLGGESRGASFRERSYTRPQGYERYHLSTARFPHYHTTAFRLLCSRNYGQLRAA